jgi:acetyltransferase-like isoleucine patch superfamily enzyme
LGADVQIGDFTVIGSRVSLGAGSVVDSHCLIGCDSPLAAGRPLRIGAGSHIRSHSVFYLGSEFGPRLHTGHHVTVREGTRAGVDLQLGTMTDLQGDTVIGDHVRTHSSVFVPKHTKIGDFVWLFPSVVLTNDRQPPSNEPHRGPTICDYAVIAAASLVMPGVRVGRHAVVGANTLVREDVADGTLVVGSPARILARAAEITLHGNPGAPAYPWPQRFHRGYPPEVIARWVGEWPPRDDPGPGRRSPAQD